MATHEIVLSGYRRRGQQRTIPVMVDHDGVVWTEPERRSGSRAHAWSYSRDAGWQARPGVVPPGYSTVRVRRLGRGRTVLRAGGRVSRHVLTVRLTADELSLLRKAARAAGKSPGRWMGDAAVAVARQAFRPTARTA